MNKDPGFPGASSRSLLRCGIAAASLAMLAGCEKAAAPPPARSSFVSIDVTGMDCCKSLHLKDSDGAPRTIAEFKGKAVLVFFGFTQCPDVCPTALTRAVEVRRLLGHDAQKLQVVFVTLDPERDTPELLKSYTAAFDPSFIALRGDVEATKATAKEFKIFFMKAPTKDSYTLDHTTLSYLFDPQGRPRLAVRHEQSAQDVAADLKKLL